MSSGKLPDYSRYSCYTIFNDHHVALFEQFRKMGDEIHRWGESLLFQINNYMNEQHQFLRKQYDYQKQCLEQKRQECFDTALIHEQKKDNEKMAQLMTQCEGLKFQLAAFEYSTRSIPYIKLINQDNLHHEYSQRLERDDENNTITNKNPNDNLQLTVSSSDTKQTK